MESSDEGEPAVTWAWLFRITQAFVAVGGFIWLASQVYFDVNQLKKDIGLIQTSINKLEIKIDALPQVQVRPR